MKKTALLILLSFATITAFAQVVYTEDFNSYVSGTGVTVSGNSGDYPDNVSLWTIISDQNTFGSSGYLKTVNNALQSSDIDGTVLWKTKFVQTYNQPISFFINFSAAGGMESTDYINVYYRLNDADSVLVVNWNGYGDDTHTLIDDSWSPLQFYVTNLTASDSVQIIVEFKDNAASEEYNMDNVIIIAGGISNISAGNDAEPDSIYAQNSTQAEAEIVLDFSVDDDAILDADNKPTQISSLVITNTSWNDFHTLPDIFAGALLTDGTNEQTANITFSNDTIYISSIANSTSSDLGYIDDNASKNYTLKLWFNSDLGVYKTQIDTMQAGFRISANLLENNITTETSGSSFCPLGDTVNSGAAKDNIAVVASTTYFTVEPSDVQVGAIIYPYVQIETTDNNFNRDLDYNDTLTVTNNGCGSIEGDTAVARSGLAVFNTLRHKAVEANISLTSQDKQGNFTANTSSQYSVTYTVYDNYTLAYWSFDNDSQATTYAWHANTDTLARGFGVGYYLPGATTCPDAAYYAGDNSVSYFASDNGQAMWTQEWADGDEYWQIIISTKGFRNLTISSMQRSYGDAPTSFDLQYKTGINKSWTTITNITVANDWTTGTITDLALPQECSDQDTVFIRWLNTDAAGSSCDTSAIDEIIVKGQILPLSRGKYYKSAGNTRFSQSCNWLVADDKNFTVNTGIPMVPPDYYSDTIIISAGDSVIIDLADTIDQTIVEENAFLNLKNYDLYINDSTGTDFVVNGTFKDDAGAGNGINFLSTGATWELGANGTVIKTDNSSSARYRDYYEGGMQNIPATAKWILRYETSGAIPTFTAIGSYYPNLYFESELGHHEFENVGEYFSGSSSTTTIKGNLYIGGNGSGTVKVFNLNTNENPVNVLGNIIVGTNDTLLTNNGTYSGTGFKVEGDIIDSGYIKISSDTSGIIILSGSNNQKVYGNGIFKVWDFTIDKTAGKVTISLDSIATVQDTMRLLSAGLVTIDTITKLAVDSVLISNLPADKFLLKSGKTTDAAILHHTPGVPATVQRYMTKEWHLFFPEVSTSPKDSLTYVTAPWTNPNLYQYDETVEDYWLADTTYSNEDGWVKYTEANLDTTKGYLFYAHKDYTFTLPGGNLIVESKKFNLSYTDHGPGQPPAPCDTVDWVHYDGWNLVGNPFSTPIDWNKVTFNNTDNVIYYYDNSQGKYVYYSLGDGVYDFGITVNGGSRYVAVGQGFFVKANAAGAYIIIPDSARVLNYETNLWKAKQKQARPMIDLSIENNSGRDQAVVVFSEKATLSHDRFDAFKKHFDAATPELSTLINNYEHAIDFVPPVDSLKIPLLINYNTEEKLVLTINNTSNIYLYLHDKKGNTYKQICNSLSFPFEYTTADSMRFELISITNHQPEVLIPVAEFEFLTGENFSIDITKLFEDTDWGDTLQFSVVWDNGKPDWLDFDGKTITGNSEYPQEITFEIIATDKKEEQAKSYATVRTIDKTMLQNSDNTILYPNPASDKITISNAEGSVLTIYSPDGKKIRTLEITSENFEVGIKGLKSGIYIFEVNKNGVSTKYKIIKL